MSRAPDLLLVAGARPNFMKIAPIWRAVRKAGRLSQLLLHTGQHHDFEMSKSFFEDLELPEPELYLGPCEGTHAEQTGAIMRRFEQTLGKIDPRALLVVGDVNSTLACSLVAAKMEVPIAHIEAGLRSFDRSMPEEVNRLVTDVLSALHFTTCDDADENLRREGIEEEKIRQVGNVMIDSLLRYVPVAKQLGRMLPNEVERYCLVTLHRPSNVDSSESLLRIVEILERVAAHLAVVFPVHPRTHQRLEGFELTKRLEDAGVHLLEPQSYLRFLKLLLGATVVLTDSGGIQEETTVLGVPCLTVRPNTERPITIDQGTNVLVGTDLQRIEDCVLQALAGKWKVHQTPPGWDGAAAERIEQELAEWLGATR